MYYRLENVIRQLLGECVSSSLFAASVWSNTPTLRQSFPYLDKRHYMFIDPIEFDWPVGRWDISNVQTIKRFTCNMYTHPLRRWNTSNMTSLGGIFSHVQFNQPLDSWNTSKVHTMDFAFYNSTFNQPIGNWNTQSLFSMGNLFYGNHAFNQSLEAWQTDNVLFTHCLFFDATAFNQPINTWNMSKAVNLSGMFMHARAFNQPVDTWNLSAATETDRLFCMAARFNQPIPVSMFQRLQDTGEHHFDGAKHFRQEIPTWYPTPYAPEVLQLRSHQWRLAGYQEDHYVIIVGSILFDWDTQIITLPWPARHEYVQQLFKKCTLIHHSSY